eukprot:SAG25_NODE_693_length_5908_cov_4.000344_7_plen_245_part_00
MVDGFALLCRRHRPPRRLRSCGRRIPTDVKRLQPPNSTAAPATGAVVMLPQLLHANCQPCPDRVAHRGWPTATPLMAVGWRFPSLAVSRGFAGDGLLHRGAPQRQQESVTRGCGCVTQVTTPTTARPALRCDTSKRVCLTGLCPPPKAALACSSPILHSRFSLAFRNCCCGPMMLPGRIQRRYPIASLAPRRKCFMHHIRMRVPVRPRPALQCTATMPDSLSAMPRKRLACASGGGVPSGNGSS